ncbi:MAG: helix-turn-helix transcriptional regulator [Hyphomicrobiaceae bacterium]
MTDELLTMAQVRQITGWARSTVYAQTAAGSFPKPCSPPRKRVKWRRIDIERWQQAQREPRAPTVEDTAKAAERHAHAPRKGERERRRRASTLPQWGSVTVETFRRTGFEAADNARLRERLAPVDTSRTRFGSRRLGW